MYDNNKTYYFTPECDDFFLQLWHFDMLTFYTSWVTFPVEVFVLFGIFSSSKFTKTILVKNQTQFDFLWIASSY